jgi:hypothetical protein
VEQVAQAVVVQVQVHPQRMVYLAQPTQAVEEAAVDTALILLAVALVVQVSLLFAI